MKKVLSLMVLCTMTSNAFAESVSQYIEQVKKQSMSYQSAEMQNKGAELQARESDLFFTPQFFFNAQTGYDSKLPSPPFLTFDQVAQNTVSAGISQEFSFGLQAKLSYTMMKTQYSGLFMQGGVPMNDPYYDTIPAIELSLPLWGNSFGKTAKARQELALKQRLAERFGAAANAQGTLVQAEIAYWNLSAAQESVRVQKRALDAAKNILDYVTAKKNKNLGETADILQAQALTQAYRLQLEQAQIEERAARRKYNLYLNRDADHPVPSLDEIDYVSLAQASIPEARPGDRPDVKASEAQVQLAKASSALSVEQNKPTLDLYGGYSHFGRGDKRRDSISQSGWAHRDNAFVGVKFAMPLNVAAQSDAREGARQIERAAEINHRFVMYNQEQEWIDLSEKFKDAKQTLKLAQAMEKAQKAKLENERARLRQGRTTTYQVLLFEQDFLSAEINRVRSAQQIIGLKSQIQLYSHKKD